jgi:hypothetical protein
VVSRHGGCRTGCGGNEVPDAPARALAYYVEGAAVAVEYVNALSVFRRIEGTIAWGLRIAHPQASALYPSDNRTAVGTSGFTQRLDLMADAPIAGLDPALEIQHSVQATTTGFE